MFLCDLCDMVSYIEDVLPDRVSGATAVDPAVLIQDDVSLQVSIVVVSGVEVGDDPRWDAQTAQDWRKNIFMTNQDRNQGVGRLK